VFLPPHSVDRVHGPVGCAGHSQYVCQLRKFPCNERCGFYAVSRASSACRQIQAYPLGVNGRHVSRRPDNQGAIGYRRSDQTVRRDRRLHLPGHSSCLRKFLIRSRTGT
jgi:hypothetical protein